MSGVIHYATPMIAAAAEEIARVSAQTEANHQMSLTIVRANADNFGGQGSDQFQNTIAQVNHAYAQQQEQINRAGIALAQANDSQTQADLLSAAQYH